MLAAPSLLCVLTVWHTSQGTYLNRHTIAETCKKARGGGSGLWGISSLWPYMHTICTASGAEDEEEDLFDKYSDMEDVPVITRGVFQQGDIRHVQRAQKGNVGNNPWVVADQIGKWGTISNRTCSQLERPASSSPMMKTRRRRSGCR